jgi:hypothetical protein
MQSDLLLNTKVKLSLERVANEAPGGYDGLDTLGNDTLSRMLAHPDDVKIVKPIPYNYIDLREVDQNGYQVYDKSFTEVYRVILDPSDPSVDLSVPALKTMRFGYSSFDLAFVTRLTHGDIFYIGYTSLLKLPRTIMCVFMEFSKVPIRS